MKKFRNAMAASVLAFGLVVSGGTAAEAHYVGVHSHSSNFTWGGYDTVWIARDVNASCYPGHRDYYKSRPVMQPWAAWHYEWQTYCQVV